MKDLNKILLVGRLGADPVKRTTKNGTSVVNFSIATSIRRFTKKEEFSKENENLTRVTLALEEIEVSQKTEETQWHQIVVWGKASRELFAVSCERAEGSCGRNASVSQIFYKRGSRKNCLLKLLRNKWCS